MAGVLLSAGGTGGHMFPAVALADELAARGVSVSLVTDARGRRYDAAFKNISVHQIKAGTLGAGLAGKVKGAAALAAGFVQALALVSKLKPSAVVGFGGYPSVPAVLAAQLLGIPTAVHEQNAVLGKANALLARRAAAVALSWPDEKNMSLSRAQITGPLVRRDIAALHDTPYPASGKEMRLLVMGGSQGAGVLGRVVPAALAELAAEQRARLSVVQQCRPDDIDNARNVYRDAGINARLETFISDTPAQIAAAHLFIGRSGGTIFEMTAAGRPGIYVPYPYHADQQQKRNAERVAQAGGGWVMEESAFTEDALRAKMTLFFEKPDLLAQAAAAARSCGRPDAAQKLADIVLQIARKD